MAEDDKSEGLLEDAKKDTGNLETLVETMREANAMTSNIEADQRNTRRHLLEMKKSQETLLFHLTDHRWNFETYAEAMGVAIPKWTDTDDDSAQEAEDKAEQQNIFEEIRDAIKGQTADQGKETAKAAGGMMSGLGKMLGGAGLGVGAAGIGIAAVLGAGAYFIKTVEDLDTEKIVDNVKNLLSISDEMGGKGELFKEAGTFYVTMMGIGVGLAAFAIGAGAAQVVQKFETPGWPEKIKENVKSLLSISDELGGNKEMLKDGGAFFLTMTGLGLGLAAFGIGQAASGVGGAINEFASGENWAENIKKEVETLLSIGTLGFWDTAGIVATLTGLGLGLAMFAIGKTASGVGDAVSKFQGENFAEDIKKEVEILLSISKLEGIGFDTAKFVAVMGGLGLGLAAFAIGKAGSGAADALTTFQGDNFAKDIKAEVETLLTIGAETDMGQVDLTVEALAKLGAGLAAFALGKGLNVLADVGAAVVGFFTGTKSPIEQALALADRAQDIDEGVDAFNRFGDVLERFTGIKGVDGDWALEEMADDLLNASEILKIAIAGGTDYRGVNQDYTGIANIEGMDQALANMALLKSAFTIEVPTTGIDMNTAAMENAENQSGGTAVVATDNSNSSVNTNSQTIITAPMIDKTTMVMQQTGSGPGQ